MVNVRPERAHRPRLRAFEPLLHDGEARGQLELAFVREEERKRDEREHDVGLGEARLSRWESTSR
jgi:hypothetical protein